MIFELWSRPVFEILSILDIDPEVLILEPVSFRSIVGHANQYTIKTLVSRQKKTCDLIESTDNPNIFEQQYVDGFVYFGVPLGSLARIPVWL